MFKYAFLYAFLYMFKYAFLYAFLYMFCIALKFFFVKCISLDVLHCLIFFRCISLYVLHALPNSIHRKIPTPIPIHIESEIHCFLQDSKLVCRQESNQPLSIVITSLSNDRNKVSWSHL